MQRSFWSRRSRVRTWHVRPVRRTSSCSEGGWTRRIEAAQTSRRLGSGRSLAVIWVRMMSRLTMHLSGDDKLLCFCCFCSTRMVLVEDRPHSMPGVFRIFRALTPKSFSEGGRSNSRARHGGGGGHHSRAFQVIRDEFDGVRMFIKTRI